MTLASFFIEQLPKNPVYFISVVFAVVLSVVLHELGHGVAALWQGDETPRLSGHMTWNPMVHMGGFSLVLLLVAGIAFGSMPVNPRAFRSRYGDALVSFAGPAVNVILALLSLTIFAIWVKATGGISAGAIGNFQNFFWIMGYLNLVLFVFNLLPIPPLDGSAVLADFSEGYRNFIRNPNNQPFFMGGFLLIFLFAGEYLFSWAMGAANAYLSLFHV